jgi:hypothetical protein
MGVFATGRTCRVNGAPAIGARAHPGGTTWVPMWFCFIGAGAEVGTRREAPGATQRASRDPVVVGAPDTDDAGSAATSGGFGVAMGAQGGTSQCRRWRRGRERGVGGGDCVEAGKWTHTHAEYSLLLMPCKEQGAHLVPLADLRICEFRGVFYDACKKNCSRA